MKDIYKKFNKPSSILKNVSLSEREFLSTGNFGKMFGCRHELNKGNYNYENTMFCRNIMAVSIKKNFGFYCYSRMFIQ